LFHNGDERRPRGRTGHDEVCVMAGTLTGADRITCRNRRRTFNAFEKEASTNHA